MWCKEDWEEKAKQNKTKVIRKVSGFLWGLQRTKFLFLNPIGHLKTFY